MCFATINFAQFLYDWQTLVAGLAALVGAILGVRTLNKQIRLSEKHELQRREAAEAAAKAVLPLTLSSITEYTEHVSDFLFRLLESSQGELIPENARMTEPPNIPETAIESIQALIQSSNKKDIVKALSKLIKMIQILNSRLRSEVHRENSSRHYHCRTVNVIHIETRVINTAIIHAYACSLFDFARGESDTPNDVNWDQVEATLRILNWVETEHNRIFETIHRYRDNDVSIETVL